MSLWHIINFVIPNCRPFRSFSNCFWDSMFWAKKFWTERDWAVLMERGCYQFWLKNNYQYTVKLAQQNTSETTTNIIYPFQFLLKYMCSATFICQKHCKSISNVCAPTGILMNTLHTTFEMYIVYIVPCYLPPTLCLTESKSII